MKLTILYLTNNNCYKAGKTITPEGIMVHSTGANNPNLKRYVGPDDGILGQNTNNNHWNTAKPGGKEICVHAFIGLDKNGTVRTYQTLPWNHRGWHAGSGNKGSANNTHISFEICEDGLKDAAYFAKIYQESVELCVTLCKKYNLNPLADGVLICHSEGYSRGIASNHSDVMHWFPKHGKSMDTFRKDVKAALDKSTASQSNIKGLTLRLNSKNAIVNGKVSAIDTIGSYPYILNSRTMVPVRFTSEKMGATVKWTANNKPVIIKYGSNTVELTVGSKTITVTKSEKTSKITIDQVPFVRNGRIYVPLRAVAENLGFSVKYDSSTKVIVMSENPLSAEDLAARIKEASSKLK